MTKQTSLYALLGLVLAAAVAGAAYLVLNDEADEAEQEVSRALDPAPTSDVASAGSDECSTDAGTIFEIEDDELRFSTGSYVGPLDDGRFVEFDNEEDYEEWFLCEFGVLPPETADG